MKRLVVTLGALLALSGCAERSVKLASRVEFRNVRVVGDGRHVCDVGHTAIDARTRSTIVFCK